MVAVKPDVTDTRSGNEPQDSFNHSESGSKDWYEGELLAADMTADCFLKGRLHVYRLDRKVNRCLIRHQHCNLVDQLLEDFRRRVVVSQDSQLVLNKRMPDYCESRKFGYLFDHFLWDVSA